jgi:hypothetical protein
MTAEEFGELPPVRQSLAFVQAVFRRLSRSSKGLIFPGLSEQSVNEILVNPDFTSRILRRGVDVWLPPPSNLIEPLHVEFFFGSDRRSEATKLLALLLQVSRLRGALGKEDIRRLIQVAGEKSLAFAWSLKDTRTAIASDEDLLAMSEEDLRDLAHQAIDAQLLDWSAWWARWISPPATVPQALLEGARHALAKAAEMVAEKANSEQIADADRFQPPLA